MRYIKDLPVDFVQLTPKGVRINIVDLPDGRASYCKFQGQWWAKLWPKFCSMDVIVMSADLALIK